MDDTYEGMAHTDLFEGERVMKQIEKDSFLSYADEAAIATRAQYFATRAVAYALLEVAEAIREPRDG